MATKRSQASARATRAPAAATEAPAAQRIRAAALLLFAERGFDATGIRDIAAEAQVTLNTLYHHAGTKEGLLVALAGEAATGLLERGREVAAQAATPVERVARLARAHVLVELGHPLEAAVLDGELRHARPAVRAVVDPLLAEYAGLWEAALAAGADAGAFSVDDLRLTRLAVLALVDSPDDWFRPGAGARAEDVATAFAVMALALLGVTPARARRAVARVEAADARP